MGPFSTIKVRDHTLFIDENGIQNTVCVQRATLAPGQDSASVPSSNTTHFSPSRDQEPDSEETQTEFVVNWYSDIKDKKKPFDTKNDNTNYLRSRTHQSRRRISLNTWYTVIGEVNHDKVKKGFDSRSSSTLFSTAGSAICTCTSFVEHFTKP